MTEGVSVVKDFEGGRVQGHKLLYKVKYFEDWRITVEKIMYNGSRVERVLEIVRDVSADRVCFVNYVDEKHQYGLRLEELGTVCFYNFRGKPWLVAREELDKIESIDDLKKCLDTVRQNLEVLLREILKL
jgi:hypothetical protein